METLDSVMTKHRLQLNAQQRKAVARIDGPTLLLAVPGSGKTTVVICRIAFMVRVRKIPAESILTLTFSRAGARELDKRYRKFFGEQDAQGLRFSTIHSFSLSVIRNYERLYNRKAFKVVESQALVLQEVFKQEFKGYLDENEMTELISAITYCKNMMLNETEIAKIEVEGVDFPKAFRAYEDYKRKRGLMDFDDMLKYAWLMLKQNPELLKVFRSQYRYINIDEAQDTSKIQYEIIKLLAGDRPNVFMVGDEDQSIYGFRGAYPDGLLSFKETYPGGEVLLMETNHRSTAAIVTAANRFIQLNKERYLKHMRTDNQKGVGAVQEFVKTVEAQYWFILKSVQSEAKETAVLYRNNESAIPLVDLFEREGVAYTIKEHNPLFFSHFILQDVRAFGELAQDPTNFEAFEGIFYKMNCNISRKNLQDAAKRHRSGQNVFEVLLSLPETPDWLVEKLRKVKACFERLPSMKALEALDYMVGSMGYREHLDYRISMGCNEDTLNRKLDILRTLAAREDSLTALFERLETLQSALKTAAAPGRNAVTLSTIHASKGLEFEKVFIIDAVEGEFPSMAALDDTDEAKRLYSEEVRLFYVGVTRAKAELEFLSVGRKDSPDKHRPVSQFVKVFLGAPVKRRENPSVQSKMIADRQSKPNAKGFGVFDVSIVRQAFAKDSDCSMFKEGAPVTHRGFGEGVVLGIAKDMATIEFESCGVKKLNLKVCVTNKIITLAD